MYPSRFSSARIATYDVTVPPFFRNGAIHFSNGLIYVLIFLLIGGLIGAFIAYKIPMTAMPELVAGFHSLVGLSAVLVAVSAFLNP